MVLPFGQVLVGAVGAIVIGVGIAQIVKGVKQKFTEDLDRGVRPAVRRLGTVGYCVKGIALGIIGGLFVWAAVTYDPKKAGGMDAALTTDPGPAVRHGAVGDHGGRHRMLRGVLLLLGANGALLSLRSNSRRSLGGALTSQESVISSRSSSRSILSRSTSTTGQPS